MFVVLLTETAAKILTTNKLQIFAQNNVFPEWGRREH
jgi:hypothetical protein